MTSQVFDVTTSAAIEDGMAWRYRWRSVGGVCPSVDTAYFDELAIPFATSMTVDGIRDGFCARVLVTAIDPGRTLGQAISPAVIGHDATAPRIRSRRPTSGSTGASITVSPRFYLNEPVTGVSGVTVQLRNLSSGRLVTAAVSYNRDLRRVTINPALNLRRGTWYRVTVRSGIKDWAGNPLAPTYWRFKTAP